jgi:arylsulfatase A-like enzyme
LRSRVIHLRKALPVVVALAILLTLLPLWTCGKSRPPNVLLISLDACRADHLGSYGYERDTSPFLDELADRGTRFSNAFINTLGTAPSHTTMLSSTYQEWHQVDYKPSMKRKRARRRRVADRVPRDVTMVQQVLRDHGYTTLAATAGGNFGVGHGFDRGFDTFNGRSRDVTAVVDKMIQLIERDGDSGKPIFAVLHTYEIHSPYDPPEAYRTIFGTFDSDFEPTSRALLDVMADPERSLSSPDFQKAIALYDGEIRYTDDTLRTFFDHLDEIGFLDDALVIVTSDHGEEFGDHGGVLHQGFLYDELMKIPLILSGRGIGSRVDERLVSTIDIAPTVLDYIGVPIPETMMGHSLLDRASRSRDGDAVFAQYGPRRYAIRTEQWKLIDNTASGFIELFDMVNDPGEQENLARGRPDIVEELAQRVEAFKARHRAPKRKSSKQELDPEEIKHLKALGYLGGT